MTINCPTCHQKLDLPEDLYYPHLQPSELRILIRLYAGLGTSLSCDEFYKHSRGALNVHLCKIREALQDSGSPYLIETIRAGKMGADTFFRLIDTRVTKHETVEATKRPKTNHP